MIHNIPQPELERHLVNLVSKEPNIEYRTGVSFYYLDQVRCPVNLLLLSLDSLMYAS